MRRVKTVESSCRAAAAGMLDHKTLAILKGHAWDRNFYTPEIASSTAHSA